MRSPGKDFREAFVASRFSGHVEATSVRLLKPVHGRQTPDFAILLNGSELWFETTEIDHPARRRGDEHKTAQEPIRPFEESEWSTPEMLEEVVRIRVHAKTSKHYEKCDGLVIWCNAVPVERSDEMDKAWWELYAGIAEEKFDQVWIGQNEMFTRLFSST